jgi:hypothetical protein
MVKTIIGLLSVEVLVPEADSLKAKRKVIKSMKERLTARFNVSVAEVADHDKWQRANLAVCAVSNDQHYLQTQLQKVLLFFEHNRQLEVIKSRVDYY